MKAFVVCAVILSSLVFANWLHGAEKLPTPPGPGAPAAAAQPSLPASTLPAAHSGLAAALSRRLTASTGVTDAIAATREVLALGGLATWDGQRFLAEAAAPAAAGYVIPEETVVLAMEARQRPTSGRLTLAELGTMLKDLGWPFREGVIPGEQLRDIFQAWVTDGLTQPADRLSFTPLFLREMALTQQPAIDLAKGDYDPEQLHLTLLELELFAAHFDRISGPAADTPRTRVPAPSVAKAAAPATEPCPELKRWMDSSFDLGDPGQAAGAGLRIILSDATKAGLKEALQAAGFTKATADRFGKALSALSIASRLWKLLALYTQAQVAVTVKHNPVHAPSSTEAKKMNVFRASAGVSDKDWEEYQQAMTTLSSEVARGLRDCFRVFGLPVFPDLGDMGKEAKDWHVEWRLRGAPERVRINEADNTFARPGILRVNLEPEGDHGAVALFNVEILPEKGAHSGPEKQAVAVASAALHTAKPPSIATWVNAVKGGLGNILALSNALVELCAGWMAEMAPPKAYASVAVSYHESAGVSWSGRITKKKIKMEDEAESGRSGRYAFMNYSIDYSSATSTVEVGRGTVTSKTQLEEIWDLSGSATVILKEEHLTDNWREDNGCKAGEVAIEHEKTSSVMNAGGTGSVTGTLMVSNNGKYQLDFGSLPEAKGQTQTEFEYWWENKPCVDDKRHDTSPPSPHSGHGPTIFIEGELNPKKPGVLSGHYDTIDNAGYTIIVTWSLREKY